LTQVYLEGALKRALGLTRIRSAADAHVFRTAPPESADGHRARPYHLMLPEAKAGITIPYHSALCKGLRTVLSMSSGRLFGDGRVFTDAGGSSVA